ncbi:MAG: oxidoreductase [Flavobacteriales bacterium]|nr:MAG: oxidoreductase [Flavobacteriales bacterium]
MNVLIIGYGSIAKKHIAALKKIDLIIEIWCLRFKSTNLIDGIKNIYQFDEIPKNIDFAIISNPTNKHIATIKELIPLKIPLFIEKPVAHNLDHLDEINLLLKKENIISYVACVLRFHPCLQYVKKQLATNSERINEVNIYSGSYLPDWRPTIDYRTNYSTQTKMGGGVHLDLFHEIDYTFWIFGNPLSLTSNLDSKSSLKIDSFDAANYLFKYEDFNVNMVLNYFRKIPKRKMEIVFSDKLWEIDLINGVIIENEKKELFKSELSIIDLYKIQLEYFINQLEQKIDTENNFEASAKILKHCLRHE